MSAASCQMALKGTQLFEAPAKYIKKKNAAMSLSRNHDMVAQDNPHNLLWAFSCRSSFFSTYTCHWYHCAVRSMILFINKRLVPMTARDVNVNSVLLGWTVTLAGLAVHVPVHVPAHRVLTCMWQIPANLARLVSLVSLPLDVGFPRQSDTVGCCCVIERK